MNFDHQAVCACCRCRESHGLDEAALSGGVAGVNNDRQMTQLLQNRNCRKVKGISCIGFKSTDATLAEDDVLIAAGHDILGAHQPLLIGGGHAALDHDGLVLMTNGLQQIEVLHVAGTNLNHIYIFYGSFNGV